MKKIRSKKIRKTATCDVFVFENTLKPRIPIAPPGIVHKSLRDKRKSKRGKITLDNWDML